MAQYDPNHYRFRRTGNLDDDPLLRKKDRLPAILDVLVFWLILTVIGVSVWVWY